MYNKYKSGQIGVLVTLHAVTMIKRVRFLHLTFLYVISGKMARLCKRDGCNNIISDEKDRRQKYCSRKCAAIVNNKYKKKYRYCKICGKELLQYQKKYCSRKCMNNYIQNTSNRYNDETIKNKYQMVARKYYIAIRGNICEYCNNTTWLNHPIPLELHHEDGDYTNNSPENVKLLCPNCHTFTITYGIKNNGYGRKSRKSKLDIPKRL